MNNKAILLYNLSGSFIGGAQKRYLNLFNEIVKEKDNYLLIINRKLYESASESNILTSNKGVLIISDYKHKSEKQVTNIARQIYTGQNQKSKSCRINLGQIKSFIKYIFRWIYFARQLYNIVRKNKISLVYAVWTGGVWAWSLQRIAGFKMVYSYNDSSMVFLSRKILDVFNSEYWPIKYSYKVDFLSKGIYSNFKHRFGFPKNRRATITPHSFINYTNYFPVYPKKDVIVFMSRLTKWKNPILFLEAIQILARNDRLMNYTILIIGQGVLEYKIKSFIEKEKLEMVQFIGPTSEPWKYLQTSKIFISVQENENYPSQSLIEAMACENAIIASDVGETNLLVSSREGRLTSLTAIDIANSLDCLISNEPERQLCGERARNKVIQNHTIDNYKKYFYSITKSEQ